MDSITINNKEVPFRCNMYVISKLLKKKQLTNADEMLGNLGHLELVEIFYESVKAGSRKENVKFNMTLDDFGDEISDDLDIFKKCFDLFQSSLTAYTDALGIADEGKE